MKAIQNSATMLDGLSNALLQRSVDCENLSNSQQQHLDSLASATEEMAGSVRGVASDAVEASDGTQQATTATFQGKERVNQTLQAINALSDEINETSQPMSLSANLRRSFGPREQAQHLTLLVKASGPDITSWKYYGRTHRPFAFLLFIFDNTLPNSGVTEISA